MPGAEVVLPQGEPKPYVNLPGTAAQAGIPWYYGIHLGLDNGVGG
jgi:hypothetical protein